MIILVDENDQEIGEIEKIEAHKNRGKLHRAFSIFIFNSNGELMLQRRASTKHHWAGFWTNTCCSHPRVGEKLEDAVCRRLKEEMGLRRQDIATKGEMRFDCALKEAFALIYKATDEKTGLTEYEYDHFFTGVFDGGAPEPNPDEVSEWKFMSLNNIKTDLKINADMYTPWFKIGFDKIAKSLELKDKN